LDRYPGSALLDGDLDDGAVGIASSARAAEQRAAGHHGDDRDERADLHRALVDAG